MSTHALIAVLAVSLFACGDDIGSPARTLEASVDIEASGFSKPFEFTVPEGTRSITIIAEGDPSALYALGSFETGEGEERVGIDLASAPGPAMRSSYDVEQIGQMEGGLFQTIRLGTFTHVFPYRPDHIVAPGRASVRIASDKPGPITLTVLMPEDDGAHVLHANLILASETLMLVQPPSFLDEVQAIFTQVGITIVIDNIIELRGSGLSTITQSTEPQEAPESMSAQLPGRVAEQLTNDALDIFIVDSLPSGIGGLSLGTPGPPIRGSYYSGVIVRRSMNDMSIAIVIAHEASHFLALQHVTNVGVSGMVYPDPIDDTQPGQGNLMQSGSLLTPGQGFALSRSALLRVE